MRTAEQDRQHKSFGTAETPGGAGEGHRQQQQRVCVVAENGLRARIWYWQEQ